MNEVKVEGPIENRFKIYWCDIDNKPFEVEAEYETPAEVLAPLINKSPAWVRATKKRSALQSLLSWCRAGRTE